MVGTKILYAAFTSAADFLARLDVEGEGPGRLVVDTRTRYRVGEQILLEIDFQGMPGPVLIRARALSMEEPRFEIETGEEQKRDFLVAIAAGRASASFHRRHDRFPMRLPARFVADGEDLPLRGDAETTDLGTGGVFLRTTRALPEGARITVLLDPCDGSVEVELSGRVRHTRADEQAEAGVGIQFDRLGSDDGRRLRRLIRDVRVGGKVVEWEAPAKG